MRLQRRWATAHLSVLFMGLLCTAGCTTTKYVYVPAPAPTPTPAPAPAPETAERSAAGEFAEGVKLLRASGQRLAPASAMVMTWRANTGKRLVLRYIDTTPPAKSPVGWVLHGQAKTKSDQIIGTLSIILPSLEPGRYRGSAQNKTVAIASALGKSKFEANDPDVGWSVNGDGWCEIVLQRAPDGVGLEGAVRARLVTNAKDGSYTIEAGYFYVSKPNVAACADNDRACWDQAGLKCMNENNDMKCALESFQKSCAAGSGSGCMSAGVIYENGPSGISADLSKAFGYYDKACDLGDRRAAAPLVKVTINACEKGIPGACSVLGIMLYKGEYCGTKIPQNMTRGVELLCIDCRRGVSKSCEFVSNMSITCN